MAKGKGPTVFQQPVQALGQRDITGIFGRALDCHQRGHSAQAEALYREVLALHPRHPGALQNLGLIALHRGDPRSALPLLRKAARADARNALAHLNLGIVQQQLGDTAAALASFTRAAALQPDFAEAHCARGTALGKLRRFADSLGSYDRALTLRPDYPEALDGRGNALTDLDRHEEAIAAYDRALALRPDYVEALENRAYVLGDLNRYREALADHDRALALRPDFGRAHFDASMALLVTGNFTRGWQEFEWRWRVEAGDQDPRGFRPPRWLGPEPLTGKTILLHAEQGLGDSIQFSRYAPRVAARGAQVILEVQPALTTLLAQLPGVGQVIARGDPLPDFDVHCPLLSLPLAFGTDLDSIPASPAYLAADTGAVTRWQATLGPRTRPRVGLVWSGSSAHRNDRNRSVPLQSLTRLCTDDFEFVSLQKEVRPADRAVLRAQPLIRDAARGLGDFSDTAALIACLDLVISVDTAVAHLAGALGKPVWILLPFAPDWRWLLEREDSPWYPTARLFRQPAPGDWESVIAQAESQLQSRFNSSGLQPPLAGCGPGNDAGG